MYLLVPRDELRPISCLETDISSHFRVTKRVFLWTQEGWGVTKAFVHFHLSGESHLSLFHFIYLFHFCATGTTCRQSPSPRNQNYKALVVDLFVGSSLEELSAKAQNTTAPTVHP